MAYDTRERFLDTAEALFAERGFYGVSIAAIADQLGLTKQALLHHFGSKEKLYGQVLKRISEHHETLAASMEDSAKTPEARLKSFLLLLLDTAELQQNQTRLLMRELLDNNQRAETAGSWYLKPFLKQLANMVRAIPQWTNKTEAEAISFAYQFLGAINYFAISQPTLSGMFGQKAYRKMHASFKVDVERLIESALAD